MGAAATGASTVRDGWVFWEAPGKPVAVRLSFGVVSRLRLAVWEGFKALPRRGLETGGLLIGTPRNSGGHVVVEIEDFEAMESEHAAGPSYLLSEADRRLLESRIAAHGTSGKHPHVVGFYRSHTRNGFSITLEDEYVFSNYFRKSSDVFLLIKSNDNEPPTGGFLIREGGKIRSETPYSQFTFSSEFSMHAADEDPPTLPPPVPVPAIPAQTAVAVAAPSYRLAAWRPAIFAAVGAAILTAAVSFAIWRRPPNAVSDGIAAPLALSISNSERGLRLSWNHRASQHASRAILWIRDGEVEHKVGLDAKQLGEGSIAYWPTTSDVDFRLQLLGPAGSHSESVRSIGGPVRPSEQPAPIAPVSPPIPQILPTPAVRPESQKEIAPRQPVRLMEFQEPPVQHAAISEPPAIAQRVAPELPKDLSFLSSSKMAPIREPGPGADARPYSRVRVEPLQHLSRSFPLVGKRRWQTNYVPPAPVREPSVPVLPARNLEHSVDIDVKVYVDRSGKVEFSEVLSKVTPDNRDLAASAVFAARKCEFVPAHAGSERVPGEVVLHYTFGPARAALRDRDVAVK